MIFRTAGREEAQTVLALYKSVIGTQFCTWNEFYPGETEVRGDLAAGTLFVLERDGALIGAVSIVPANEMDAFDCWRVRENAREFARVVIAPSCQGAGLSRRLADGVIGELRRRGASAIHIAVAKLNIPAQRLYRGAGFDFCGEADMYGSSYFLCEKIL